IDDPGKSPTGDELPPGLDSGLFLHDLFEHVELDGLRRAADANAWLAEPGVAALLAEHGRERGIAPMYHAHAARLVYAALATPIEIVGRAPLPALALADAFAREVEFAYPIPASSGQRGLVTGFVD